MDIEKLVFGELSDFLRKLRVVPLLRITLSEATKLDHLHRYITEFIPMAFLALIHAFVCKRPDPIPEAAIKSWESLPGLIVEFGFSDVGWRYLPSSKLDHPITPKEFYDGQKSSYQFLKESIEKRGKKASPLTMMILGLDWDPSEKVPIEFDAETNTMKLMTVKEFVGRLRRFARKDGVGVITLEGFVEKYDAVVTNVKFEEKWKEYRRGIYLELMERFPMIAYSMCHNEYLAYKEDMNRANLDLMDGKYPEAIAMSCRALENVLRIFFFMNQKKEAPEKELGWLVQALQNSITGQMGEIYYHDLEFILNYRSYAVHAKKVKKELTELDALQVYERVSMFCKVFFYQKWKIRI